MQHYHSRESSKFYPLNPRNLRNTRAKMCKAEEPLYKNTKAYYQSSVSVQYLFGLRWTQTPGQQIHPKIFVPFNAKLRMEWHRSHPTPTHHSHSHRR